MRADFAAAIFTGLLRQCSFDYPRSLVLEGRLLYSVCLNKLSRKYLSKAESGVGTMNDLNNGESTFLQSILNAIPHPVFVVDDDVRILAFNRVAGCQLADLSDQSILRRGGDVLKCLHANESPLGCGRGTACKKCDIRNSVKQALQNGEVYRTRVKMDTLTGEMAGVNHLLITTAPFEYQNNRYVLLTLEDINDLIALRNFVPICAKCKNIRNDENYWIRLEQYFKDKLNLDFSHGICPECSGLLYSKNKVKK